MYATDKVRIKSRCNSYSVYWHNKKLFAFTLCAEFGSYPYHGWKANIYRHGFKTKTARDRSMAAHQRAIRAAMRNKMTERQYRSWWMRNANKVAA